MASNTIYMLITEVTHYAAGFCVLTTWAYIQSPETTITVCYHEPTVIGLN